MSAWEPSAMQRWVSERIRAIQVVHGLFIAVLLILGVISVVDGDVFGMALATLLVLVFSGQLVTFRRIARDVRRHDE